MQPPDLRAYFFTSGHSRSEGFTLCLPLGETLVVAVGRGLVQGASYISAHTACLPFNRTGRLQALSPLDIHLILAVWAVAGDAACFVVVKTGSSGNCGY